MHGGRGDEAYPEVHEGVVLPADGGIPGPGATAAWGSGPAAGQPWGEQPQAYGPPHQSLPDTDATQLFPPYPQARPPMPAHEPQQPPAPQFQPGPVADATQVLPPYPMPGAAPYGVRPGTLADADATQHLPRFEDAPAPQQAPGYGYPHDPQGHQGNDAMLPAQQPHDDFGHLYRQDGPPPQQPGYAASPDYAQPAYGQQPAYAPQPSYDYDQPAPARRKLTPAALIGIVVGGCAVAGLLAGALMSGGDDDPAAAQSPSASSSASSPASSGGGDEGAAEEQAKGLEALLKTSGSNRTSVINAVAGIKGCRNLDGAAADLRAAAQQRNDLMTQLKSLPVDQLPNHQDLTDALNKAWTASAAADNHYAAWADQLKAGKKLCRHGQARHTDQYAAGNTQSGTATQAKSRAAALWNPIAKKYGLTQHQGGQL
ncbi:hypothetical protein PV341_40895 [Streptomyces sp. PA03-1a]|nr:hypothetical protein [Streptomyces sp. PA03-1a]MDX2817929.1 hypothetical protein [Streptomyces sp. PA03-5A]